MKVIDISNFNSTLTVDSTLVTADSTLITCDTTLLDNNNFMLTLTPRVMPATTDTLSVTLRNELTNVEVNSSFDWGILGGLFRLYLLDTYYKVGDKYELNVFNGSNNIIKEKVLIVAPDQDIQNYTHTTITTNKITY